MQGPVQVRIQYGVPNFGWVGGWVSENRNCRRMRAGNEAGTYMRYEDNYSLVVSVVGSQMNHGSQGGARKRRRRGKAAHDE